MLDIHDPITAMSIITLFALIMNLISTILNKYWVYTPEFIERKRFVDSVRKEYMRALRSRDERQIKKLEKKMEGIKKMEAQLSLSTFKPLAITFLLFWILWWFLQQLYGVMGKFVLSPIPIPFYGVALDFFGWYIITSVWLGIVLRKLLIPEL